MADSLDDFDNLRVVEPVSILEYEASNPLSSVRDKQYVSGTGVISDTAESEYEVRKASGGSGEATLVTARRARYSPGYLAEAGIGVRVTGTISDASSLAEWGYFEEDGSNNVLNGILFGVDATGTYVRVVKAGSDILAKTYISDWNVLDPGFGGSRYEALNSGGRVYQIPFVYYGYGLTKFKILDARSQEPDSQFRLVHAFATDNETTLGIPNLKLGARVRSTDSADDFSVFVAGRKFHVFGNVESESRTNGETVYDKQNITTIVPVMSFRNKGGDFRGIAIQPEGYDCFVAGDDVEITVRILPDDSTLTSASFGSLSETPVAETAAEVDTSATAVSTSVGSLVFRDIIPAGTGRNIQAVSEKLSAELGDDQVLAFCAKSLGGAAATVNMVARIKERW